MRPPGTVDAARQILAEGRDVDWVQEVVLRDIDRFEDNPRVVTLIPIGSVIGIVVHRHDERPKDSEIVFVAARAFGATLAALGFTAATPAVALIPPHDRTESA